MAGYPITKQDVDSRAGYLVFTLRETFDGVVTLKAWLDSKTDTELTGMGWTSAEVTILRASFTDLAKLGQIAHAAATQAAVSDFFFNAKSLTGLS
jgi:hypothetical protein